MGKSVATLEVRGVSFRGELQTAAFAK